MNANLPLENKTILVTRPEGLADSLRKRINDAGGTAKHYPVIKITELDESKQLSAIIDNLTTFDIAIFISPTSVISTLKKIKSLPSSLTIAAIGRSTASTLNEHGLAATIVPDNFNSESLLQHPAFQLDKIANKSIVIFRGLGGRDLLGDTLSQRGASVTYAEIYQREKNNLASLSTKELASLDALSITSNQGLQFLFELTDNKAALTLLPIIVPGDRAKLLARQLGFNQIIQASNATDDACIQSLINYFPS